MNIRTLSKEDTIHMVNLACMVLAWGVSSYFFDATASNTAVAAVGDAFLSPFYFVDSISIMFFKYQLTQYPITVFTILWLTYFLLGTRLSSLLMVKNHEVNELKSWYFARKSHQ